MRIVPSSPSGVAALLAACSPESLRQRFWLPDAAPVDDLLRTHGRYLLGGAGWLALSPAGQPVGLLNASPGRVVEVAVLVADGWRRRGVATALISTALASAPDGDLLRLAVRPDNPGAVALARRWAVGATIAYEPGGCTYTAPLRGGRHHQQAAPEQQPAYAG